MTPPKESKMGLLVIAVNKIPTNAMLTLINANKSSVKPKKDLALSAFFQKAINGCLSVFCSLISCHPLWTAELSIKNQQKNGCN